LCELSFSVIYLLASCSQPSFSFSLLKNLDSEVPLRFPIYRGLDHHRASPLKHQTAQFVRQRKSTLPTKLRQAQPTQKEDPNATQNVVAKQNKKPHANKTTDDPIYIWGRGRHLRAKRASQQLLIVENQKHSILKTHAKV
jgi:hypothetical protein